VGVDCSLNMLRKARACFQKHDVRNVHLLNADVADLPIRDGGVDIVLSMKGTRRRSDWFVRQFGARNGYVTPPFFTLDNIAQQFEDFMIVRQDSDGSIAWFEATKQDV
jgi:agmatine/peptidylarginine deiminase